MIESLVVVGRGSELFDVVQHLAFAFFVKLSKLPQFIDILNPNHAES